MNFLILGDGPEERAWAETLARRSDHRVLAAMPGLPDLFPDIPAKGDLEAALAVVGIEAVIVGGPLELRDEALRRTAASGFAAICLHPPGENADPYYQVALSREETGAVVVPDLPGRLHPGVAFFRRALAVDELDPSPGARLGPARAGSSWVQTPNLGPFRAFRIEASDKAGDRDLLETFARWVDVARVFLGEVESLTALGDPPGESPSRALTVQLRGPGGRSAELRLSAYPLDGPARLTLECEQGALGCEVAPDWLGPSRLTRTVAGETISSDLDPWDPHAAILEAFERSVAGEARRPDLIDGTRSMELTSSVARSLRRGRAVDLHYEEVSEANNFKTVMTSVGCMVLLGCLVALPAALVGPALGIGQTIYIAYAIPPLLVVFALMQVFRLALKPSSPSGKPAAEDVGG